MFEEEGTEKDDEQEHEENEACVTEFDDSNDLVDVNVKNSKTTKIHTNELFGKNNYLSRKLESPI